MDISLKLSRDSQCSPGKKKKKKKDKHSKTSSFKMVLLSNLMDDVKGETAFTVMLKKEA